MRMCTLCDLVAVSMAARIRYNNPLAPALFACQI